METRGLVAEYNAMAGLLTVWASTQAPHQVRQFICELLDLPPHRVRVIAPDVGGGFGAKLIVCQEGVLIPFLARRCGRPVRWLEDRLEHMLTATQERTQIHTVEVGFDDEGRLLALRDQFVHDTGAYTPRGLVVPLLSASMLGGPYRIPSIEVTFDSVYTNRVPVTPYRGAGQPPAASRTSCSPPTCRTTSACATIVAPATSSTTAATTRPCSAARSRCRTTSGSPRNVCAPAGRGACSASASRATSS